MHARRSIICTSSTTLMRLRPPVLHRGRTGLGRPDLRTAPGYSCGFALRSSIADAPDLGARTSGLRPATHAASRSGPPSRTHRTWAPGPPDCARLLMRLRAPVLHRGRTGLGRPDLRTAPGYSCGFALRSSIADAPDLGARTSGLRPATHAASRSGPPSRTHRTWAPGPPDCARLLMRLRAPVLHRGRTGLGRPDLR